MRARGIVLLLVAVLLSVAAVFVARQWLTSQVQTSGDRDSAGDALVGIVAARTDIPFGAIISEANLKTIKWPQSAFPTGAFADYENLLTDEPRVALRDIQANEPILLSAISKPGASASLANLIEPNMCAVTISVNDAIGVAGFVMPKDYVDVTLTRLIDNTPTTEILLQHVKVLGLNRFLKAGDKTPAPKTITLEVTPEQAQLIKLAERAGNLSLMLRGSGDAGSASVRPVSVEDLRPRDAATTTDEANAASQGDATKSGSEMAAAPMEGSMPADTSPAAQPDKTEAPGIGAGPGGGNLDGLLQYLSLGPAASAEDDQSATGKVPVVIATAALGFGSRLSEEVLKTEMRDENTIPEDAVTDIASIIGAPPRMVIRPLQPGEPVRLSALTEPGGRASLSALIAPGQRAKTIKVDEIVGVAGFVLPGDYVDIYLNRKLSDANFETRLVLENTKVLAVDQVATEESDNAKVVDSVTLEVTSEGAQLLTLAAAAGPLVLALRPLGEMDSVRSRSMTLSDLIGADAGPAPPPEPKVVQRPAQPRWRTVEIYKGLKHTTARIGVD